MIRVLFWELRMRRTYGANNRPHFILLATLCLVSACDKSKEVSSAVDTDVGGETNYAGPAPFTLPVPTSGDPNDLHATTGAKVAFTNRVYPGNTNNNAPTQAMSWSHSIASARFTGSTRVTVNIATNGYRGYLYAMIDGKPHQLVQSATASQTFGGLNPNYIHTIVLIKRTESAFTDVAFNGFTLDARRLLCSTTTVFRQAHRNSGRFDQLRIRRYRLAWL